MNTDAPTVQRATKPRLLVLASTFPVTLDDGVPAFVFDIANEVARDFDVTVLAPRVSGSKPRDTLHGVSVWRFGYFPQRFESLAEGAILDNLKAKRSRFVQVPALLIAQYFAIRQARKSLSPVAIHAHWVIPQGLIARLAAPRVPMLVTTHGGDIYALKAMPLVWLKKRVLSRAKAVTTVNQDMADTLVRWGLDSDRVTVLPMSVPLDQANEARARVTRVNGRILAVGRLVEKKGFGVLLDSLRTQVQDASWTLRIVGDGPLRAEWEQAATGLPVEFLGQRSREEVLHEMAEASIVVLPSVSAVDGDQEGLPVVLLEAAAMGASIVASDLPGINEALTHEANGLLVPQGDTGALGAAIQRLLDDSHLREKLGKAARERSNNYSTTSIGAAYRHLLGEIR